MQINKSSRIYLISMFAVHSISLNGRIQDPFRGWWTRFGSLCLPISLENTRLHPGEELEIRTLIGF